ncbi:MAG: AmmeMemoRadiSam system protein B [Bacteroidetes bacterium]|nr:MAG: AmmeMemoRadiSam system protein B [Bacteroidota bacterium]
MKEQLTRQPSVAGMFYPASEKELRNNLEELFTKASPSPPLGNIVALISPHAGYMYSGLTAAYGYKLLQGKQFDSVVIVSPSHREYFNGISVYNGSAYKTPVGTFHIDETLRFDLLSKSERIETSSRGHGAEHAIEVQLPFLSMMLGEINILPIVMGDQTRELCFELGNALAEILSGKQCLLVASTDLSHYYPYETAKKLDKRAIDDIKRFNYEQLMDDLENNITEACGGGPTVAVLAAAQQLGATDVQILHHCNSGDVTGDHSGVVGYLSAAVVKAH